MPSKLGPSLLALALALSTAPARADVPTPEEIAKARDLFMEGSKLAEAGDWEGARDRFDRSLKLKYSALTLYNLGIAQQETGHLVDAVVSFHIFLDLPVDAATEKYVEPVKAVVPKLEARLVRLEIDVRPVGVRGLVLRVDGREVPADDGPRMMDPGHHDIAVSAPGFCEAHREMALADGAHTIVDLQLRGPPERPPRVVPLSLLAGGLGLVSGGAALIGVGAGVGLSSTDKTGTKLLIAGGFLEGAGAAAFGTALLMLLVRPPARAHPSKMIPWASGRVAGVQVRF
jgi:hypothetical protein